AVHRLVPDHMRVRLLVRIDPQVLQRVVGGLALRQRLAAGLDDAPGPGVLGDQDAAVVVAVAVLVRLVRLHPVEVREEQPEQHEDDHAGLPQGCVHGWITSVGAPCSCAGGFRGAPGAAAGPPAAGLRAASEIRNSIATSSQFAINDEPPADMNGVVCPVSGISPVTPPTMT